MPTLREKMTAVEHICVTKFREYLRIKTMQPDPDYTGCSKFLNAYAGELGIESKTLEIFPTRPIVVMTIKGSDPSLKSVLLNSHTDVVPVQEDMWESGPFEANKRDNGDIVARGAQDMKCVGIWYMEAMRKLLKTGSLLRTIHILWVPDEEIGGVKGMKAFIQSEEFKKLNIGFALDEGLANENDAFKVYYGERSPWWVNLKAAGNAGHASKFITPSATEKLLKALHYFSTFRQHELNRLNNHLDINGKSLTLGDVTSCNITMLEAGEQMNCVHSVATAGIDMRLSPTLDFEKFEKQINVWAEGLELTFKQKTPKIPQTKLDTCIQWSILQRVAKKHKIELEPEIFPAATDARYLRLQGIPCFGISAINSHPVLLHGNICLITDHNEYLNEQTLIRGVDFYADLIEGIANIK